MRFAKSLVRPLSLALTPIVLITAMMTAFSPLQVGASSHREAPLVAKDPSIDPTDVYAFVSPDAPTTVTLIANWIPFEDASGGPNYYHFDDLARYNIKIDRDGDAKADIVYRWTFDTIIKSNSNPNPAKHSFLYNTFAITDITSPNFNYTQVYSVTKYTYNAAGIETSSTVLFDDEIQPPDYVGPRTFALKSYDELAASAVNSATGYKEFTGQRDDPFFVDIGAIFDLGGLRPFNNLHLIPLPVTPGLDDASGFNIHTTALQVLRSELTPNCPAGTAATDTKCVIGIWATADRPTTTVRAAITGGESVGGDGSYVQVSRLGNPLVNEAVLPLSLKDAFNALDPSLDQVAFTGGADALFGGAPVGAIFQTAVFTPELQRLLPTLYPGVFIQTGTGKNLPNYPRNDLFTIFLTGLPGVNIQTNSGNPLTTPGKIASEQLRLNVAIPPNAAGVCKGARLAAMDGDLAGWPNGRRLEDDVTDMALRAVAGGYGTFLAGALGLPNFSPGNILTDGANANDVACLPSFPYMGTPHSGYADYHNFIRFTSLPIIRTLSNTPAYHTTAD